MLQVILQIIFWVSAFAMFHSYVLYPLILQVFSRNRQGNTQVFDFDKDELPTVSVIMSLHNEETAIERKVNSLLNTTYPKDKLSIVIGSDCSTDRTNEIVESFAAKHPHIKFYPFTERQGKPNVINRLMEFNTSEVVILTDARAYFTENTVFELIKHFKNPEIAIVGGNLVNDNLQNKGISVQENAFMSRELVMKYQEGVLWGAVIGVYGACYAIRKEDYTPVPKNFTVDDFFITMKVLKGDRKAICELNAVCYETVPAALKEEFRRKVRIATGNFQNLKWFGSLLWPFYKPVAFAFLSHKVIRWLGPFFILLSIISVCFLQNIFLYRLIGAVMAVVLIIPLLDYLLQKINLNLKLFRFVTHFFSMNIALLMGFFKYLKGVKSNVWQPTQRNQ